MNERAESTESATYGIPAPGFRLHSGARVGRVRLQVAALDRSLPYYESLLGFRVLERGAARASLGAADSDIPLLELHERPGATPVPRGGRLGLFHYAIRLADRAALGAFARHLGERGEAAGASDHLVSEALYLQDPDGLGIEVYADRPRSEWRQRDGQILMATEPLDLASLIRAAGPESWGGMPSATTIGHVHLHVGDLGRAAAFYHEALGLDKVVWSYPGALFLSAGGYHHHLGLNTWARGARSPGQEEAQLLEWELLVPSTGDLESAIASLESGGYHVERSAEGARVGDPWGTALRLQVAESGENA